MYLSICSGEAPCFKVIYRNSYLAGSLNRLQLSGSTYVIHGGHVEVVSCSSCVEESSDIGCAGEYGFLF